MNSTIVVTKRNLIKIIDRTTEKIGFGFYGIEEINDILKKAGLDAEVVPDDLVEDDEG